MQKGEKMKYEQAMAALATSAVDVSSFTPGAGGASSSTAGRRPGVGPDGGRQPRPQNG